MGFCSRFSNVAVALLASTLLKETVSQELTECFSSSSPGFDYEVTVGTDMNFDIRWSVDNETQTISFEVCLATEAWVGVGFSSDGEMIGSDAVIGLPDEDSSVTEYNLTAKDVTLVLEYEEQEITDISIFQETDITNMTFTRPLAPSTPDKEMLSAIPGNATRLIYAFGTGNELAFHGPGFGNVTLDLFCGGGGAGSPTPTMDPLGPNDTPTAAATPAPVDGDRGDNTPDSPTAVPSGSPTGGKATTAVPSGSPTGGNAPTAVPSGSPTGGNAPTAVPSGSTDGNAPTTAPVDGDGVMPPTAGPSASPASEDGDAAYRVSGGLWATAATVTAAVLGAAMAV